eukprot:3566979-Amphidinium_carterae.1
MSAHDLPGTGAFASSRYPGLQKECKTEVTVKSLNCLGFSCLWIVVVACACSLFNSPEGTMCTLTRCVGRTDQTGITHIPIIASMLLID